jgi:hypothetical protein
MGSFFVMKVGFPEPQQQQQQQQFILTVVS